MNVEYWLSSSGRNYVGDFLSEIQAKSRKKIDRGLDRLKRCGLIPLLRSHEAAKLHGYDMYELIVDFGKIFYRIFFVVKAGTCYLLHGFMKKSNKTPQKEIDTALGRATEVDAYLGIRS